MIDALRNLAAPACPGDAGRLGLEAGSYVLVTLHRPSNVDDPERLSLLRQALAGLSALRPVVFPMRQNSRRERRAGRCEAAAAAHVTEPLGYAEMVECWIPRQPR
jgi:UDP-N-acetylglucosamine 2-epimerase